MTFLKGLQLKKRVKSTKGVQKGTQKISEKNLATLFRWSPKRFAK